MAEKVTGCSPISRDVHRANEAQALGALVRRLYEHKGARLLKTAMGLAIIRNGLEVRYHEHEDGTVSFDLQPAPPDPAADAPEH